MAIYNRFVAAGALVLIAGTAAAQIPAAAAEQIRGRQQLANMEVRLERAIVNGAELVMAQVGNVIPDRPRFIGTPRVSGFKLDQYGVVFYVQVPEFELPILYQVLVQERQNLDSVMTLQRLRNKVATLTGPEREAVLQDIFLLEQQMGGPGLRATEPGRGSVGAASLVPAGGTGRRLSDVDPQVVSDPQNAYRREVKEALIDAMFDQVMPLGQDEWLTIVAGGAQSKPQSPGDSLNSRNLIVRVKGSVLAAYQARSITLDEAKKQVVITEQ
jgi:hypothetical protein